MNSMQGYEHQLEVRKRDGTIYKVYIVSHGTGFTYIVYKDDAHVTSNPNVFDSIDDAFDDGFAWVKSQK